ncbi:MAG TPA: PSD1 and planctomycete cytochrome C domain-containing protein, partial [Gemmataceae bacterium]|nr:PSD1 and planctomycete cytochrome C domain-containing protein [Gemmataceae bacterium]
MTVAPRRAILCVFLFASPAPAQTPAQVEFFEKKVRPVLVEHCQSCHGEPGKKVKGGLKLTSRAGLLAGGETGPAVVPGDVAKSLLAQVVKYDGDLKMPPKGKLKPQEIADLTQWVKDGAAWPDAGAGAAVAKTGGPLFTDEQRAFWAFQPVKEPAVPSSKHAHPIDAFLDAKRAAAGLRPAPPADRRTLIRRVTYDLTGLPPTPAEVDAFLADRSANAFEKVIDRLLASPAYGERWARHWLDVARYADSNGLDENTSFGNAWRYRDYVIKSLNDDKPYDQFVKEQLAGDLLPPSPDSLTATGFLVLGPKVLAEPDKQKMVMDIVDEQIDVVSKAMLGLTISCARCHDHKFDPIPTRDYYALAGIFKSTKTMATLATVAKAHERTLASPEDEAKLRAHEAKVAALDTVAKKSKNQATPFAGVGGFAGTQAATITLNKSVAALKAAAPPVPMVLAVQDEANPADVKVHVRGNHLTLGEVAPRVFPRVIAGEKQSPVSSGSGRLPFAEWVASRENPLTARVMVNRVWMHHFGEGIVRSPDNFGKLGERPTHPELLDWLATEFMASRASDGTGDAAKNPPIHTGGSPKPWS